MPRYLKINIICILLLFLSNPASSELYQYTDENGIMRLTDNPYSVPVHSRAKLEQFTDFEGLSDDLEILPIQPKPALPAKTEKTIIPKTSKEIHVKAGDIEAPKNIPSHETEKNAIVTSKQKPEDPFQALVPPRKRPDNLYPESPSRSSCSIMR